MQKRRERLRRQALAIAALLPLWLAAQGGSAEGRVESGGRPLPEAVVAIRELAVSASCDAQGRFAFPRLQPGEYVLHAFALGYATQQQPIRIVSGDTLRLLIRLDTLSYELDAVQVQAERLRSFGIRRLAPVEGVAIYAGKKTEVILLEEVTANKAVNNPRQLFARVAGLNIWESDCGGLQLGIGGRGLSPNRSANFNTRQNGYDISADALGYPESYYSPPVEALERVEVLRGAASLQYGPQFGGLINFVFRQPPARRLEWTSRQTLGSFGLFSSFNALGGSRGRWAYSAFHQYKRCDCWRPNAGLKQQTAYGLIRYQASPRLQLRIEYTGMGYLAQQPGGLTDALFAQDPRQSLRSRNWFRVGWNLAALHGDYQVAARTRLNLRLFGNYSTRQALGLLERITVADFGQARSLIADRYQNLGQELRILHEYPLGDTLSALLIGLRSYWGQTRQQQGEAREGSGPDFAFRNPGDLEVLDYLFPSANYALFAEHLFRLGPRFSLTPGLRLEHIRTFAEGYYRRRLLDFAGNVIADARIPESLRRVRSFVLGGLGASYAPSARVEAYANVSQNYRAVTFSDLRIANPNFVVDSAIRDERGYTADLGLRGEIRELLYFDLTFFYLRYNGRIGLLLRADQPPLFLDYRFRTNVADSRTAGAELVAEADLLRLFTGIRRRSALSLFVNATFNDGRYINTDDPAIRGKRIELVPALLLRTGLTFRRGPLRVAAQLSCTGSQFTDATNALRSATAVNGLIPAYYVADLSASYAWKFLHFEAGCNNLSDRRYFTRRAEAYPGPGIIPAEGRSVYLTLGWRLGTGSEEGK